MKSTLTSKGQITIPIDIRNRLHLKPGDVLVFDENTPFLKARKKIPSEAWDDFSKGWEDPWPELTTSDVIDELRGPVNLPSHPQP
jgi:AbrB family looped-hinge helix DNA binding protein